MKMDDCLQTPLSNEQIFVVQHQGHVNGGRTRASRPRSPVFLFKKYKHRDV